MDEFATEIVRMTTADVPTGHIELVGGADDFLARATEDGTAIGDDGEQA